MDNIFQVDEAKRITVAQIQEHPWYNVPLLRSYAAAEAQIGREQALLDFRLTLKHIDAVRNLKSRTMVPWPGYELTHCINSLAPTYTVCGGGYIQSIRV